MYKSVEQSETFHFLKTIIVTSPGPSWVPLHNISIRGVSLGPNYSPKTIQLCLFGSSHHEWGTQCKGQPSVLVWNNILLMTVIKRSLYIRYSSENFAILWMLSLSLLNWMLKLRRSIRVAFFCVKKTNTTKIASCLGSVKCHEIYCCCKYINTQIYKGKNTMDWKYLWNCLGCPGADAAEGKYEKPPNTKLHLNDRL